MNRKLLFAHDDRIYLQDGKFPISFNYTRHLIDRYRYLADHVTFAVRCKAAEPIKWYEDATIVGIPDVVHGLALARYPVVRQSVRKIVSEHDVIVARLPSVIGSWAFQAALHFKKPVISEFVGCPWDALWNHSLKGKLVAPYFWLKNRRLMRQAEYTVYVTEKFLQERYPTSGFSIACSDVEIETAAPEILEQRMQRLAAIENQVDDHPIVLGTIANLNVPYKGHHLVMQALASMGQQKSRFKYRLIGPGDPTRLKNLAQQLKISQQIEFFGPCERERIPLELDRIDIYLQPSLQEGLPRAVIEAMARGCVVIGARTGGIPELIEEPWIVPRKNWRQIASLLRQIPALNLGSAAVKNFSVAQSFQMEELKQRRKKFYDRFLTDHNLSPTPTT